MERRDSKNMSNNPLVSVASTLEQKHGAELLQIASMVATTKRLLSHYGTYHNVEIAAMLKTFDQCVESHLIDRDFHPKSLRAALGDLQALAPGLEIKPA